MPILYEPLFWEEPIPKTHAPPQRIPAAKMFSPSPSLWPYLLCFGAGLFIGLPLGREILKTLAGMTEQEIRSRVEATKQKRGL